jgi:hypothetical protein
VRDPEHWKELCERAITEQDPDKFMELIKEIDRLLQEKDDRLLSQRRSMFPNTSKGTDGS